MSVAAALRIARERAKELAKPSADPRPPRTRRQAGTADDVETVAQIVDRHLDRARKDRKDFRTLRQVEGTLRRFAKPLLGKLPAYELRRKDVADMLDRVADDATPLMADQTFHHFQAAWRWASDRDERLPWPFVRGMRRTNPADHVRTRVLSDSEIAALWHATADARPFSRYVRFLLLTAARRTEAMLPWSELDAERGVWRVERSLYERANGYNYEAVKIFMPAGAKQPVVVHYTEHCPPDVGAAFIWLKNRDPEHWHDVQNRHLSPSRMR